MSHATRLRTFSIIPDSVGQRLSDKFRGLEIGAVSKYHFYNEFFGIVAYQDRDEFESAIAGGIFPLLYEEDALAALAGLKREAKTGIFQVPSVCKRSYTSAQIG